MDILEDKGALKTKKLEQYTLLLLLKLDTNYTKKIYVYKKYKRNNKI